MESEAESVDSIGPQIRVLVVDDQPLIRRGLALTLAASPALDIVGQAADGEQAIEMTAALRPDVVLMDLKMPKMGGVAATRAITGQWPATCVVVLTTYDTDELVFDAIRAGTQAYLLKDTDESELIETIQAVNRGEPRLQPQIARKIMEELRRSAPTLPSAEPREQPRDEPRDEHRDELDLDGTPISRREERLLALISQGLSNKEIARAMALAEGTVKNYTSRIMSKLHARSRTELAAKVILKRRQG